MSDKVNPMGMDQADYMKVFMQELTYQDPLKPVDNKEFMAQMAQFSALQQSTETNQHVQELLMLTASNQAVSMLNKMVYFGNSYGRVKQIIYEEQSMKLKVETEGGSEYETIRLNDINKIEG